MEEECLVLVLQSSYIFFKFCRKESWLLYFYCFHDIMWLVVFYVSSSRCCWLDCNTIAGLISKFQVGLKSLLRQGLSEPDFYGDLVYKLKKIVGSNNFSAQFIKIISHYKKIGYNINVLQQTACLVVNPITVGNFAFLFNCTPVGRTSLFS